MVKHSAKDTFSGNLKTYLYWSSKVFISGIISCFSTFTKYNEFSFIGCNGITKQWLIKSLCIWHTNSQYTKPDVQFSATKANKWCFTNIGWLLLNISTLNECKKQLDDEFLLSVIRTKIFQKVDENDNHVQSVDILIAKIYSPCRAPNLTALAPIFVKFKLYFEIKLIKLKFNGIFRL